MKFAIQQTITCFSMTFMHSKLSETFLLQNHDFCLMTDCEGETAHGAHIRTLESTCART